MNWQLTSLIGQVSQDLIDRTANSTLPGTEVPESSIAHEGTYWFPEQASTFAADVDWLFFFIFWLSTVFFVAIVFAMVYLCIVYRRKGKEIIVQPSSSHNTNLEIFWSVVPSILLVPIFWWGAEGFFDSRIAPDNAEEISVTASRYNWLFTYPDGDSSAELHLVIDRPAKLIMQSNDVLHSMYIPAFRQKMDIVPGRYTYAYVNPNKLGKYRLSCTEYCGEGHSKMRTVAVVHKTAAARKADTQWIKAEHKPWENGERTYKIHCSGCHKIDGNKATGPALNEIWGKDEKMMGGNTIKVDEQYIQNSLWDPGKDVVDGYGPVSKMNSFKGLLQQEDINHVISYLKYLKDPSLVSGEEAGDSGSEDSESGDAGDSGEGPDEEDKET